MNESNLIKNSDLTFEITVDSEKTNEFLEKLKNLANEYAEVVNMQQKQNTIYFELNVNCKINGCK